MLKQVSERITDGVAVGAVSSPLWLTSVSDFFALILPIIGVLWLAIQIWYFFQKKKGPTNGV